MASRAPFSAPHCSALTQSFFNSFTVSSGVSSSRPKGVKRDLHRNSFRGQIGRRVGPLSQQRGVTILLGPFSS